MINYQDYFSLKGENSIISPEDSGLVNGKIALNGWLHDVAEIRGVYAPPLFSDDFKLKIRFNGRTVAATKNLWEPDQLTRYGSIPGWKIVSRLIPAADMRGAVLALELTNRSGKAGIPELQYEITGGVGELFHWGFGKPQGAKIPQTGFENGVFSMRHDDGVLMVGSSLSLSPAMPVCSGVLNTAEVPTVKPGKSFVFYTFLALGKEPEVSEIMEQLRKSPEKICREARKHWQKRVEKLFSVMPEFSSDNKQWNQLYYRSMLHLLLNEWNVPEFLLHPYYGTGSINGGCICCYLWNYGEPYRMWSLLNPQSAKDHLKNYLSLDLANCYAFFPEDGTSCGPYYPVNQEKVIFLAHAYVMQTGDVSFLTEQVNGKTVIEHLCVQAMLHDDFTQPAILVDYGNGNNHLELRRTFRYDGIAPDLNLRRCVNYRLAEKLCRLAGFDPGADFIQRAENLKKEIRKKLYSAKDGWYYAVDKGKKYFRWTMQMFKALGWNGWAMGEEEEAALIKHLFATEEFLGNYGIHSLSKLDPGYDERDVDNGGPGACISFAPAIADRLYSAGKPELGDKIMERLLWLGGAMPYWGDSQRADIREYRRDTPLQSDIQGAALAQTMIFGLFGIKVLDDFSVQIKPHLPAGIKRMSLKNIRLAGFVFQISCSGESFRVVCNGKIFKSSLSGTIILKKNKS